MFMLLIPIRRFILAATIGASLLFGAAHAAAPPIKAQAPGFYRMMLGDFEITAISDGTFDLDTGELLTNTTPEQLSGLLERAFQNNAVPTSVNAYLVNTGSKLVLIDAGAAQLFGPTLGNLLKNLEASGYRPDQIDVVLITHMHPDHVGGLTADDKPVFPNAVVYADKREADAWLSASALRKSAPAHRFMVKDATASLAPYQRSGRFKTFDGPCELLSGISAVPAPGHTPGHTLFLLESNKSKLMLWGDLMEIASVQFPAPSVTIAYDSDTEGAISARIKAYDDASQGHYLVAGTHLPFPGIGHVRSEKSVYTWVPIDYDRVR